MLRGAESLDCYLRIIARRAFEQVRVPVPEDLIEEGQSVLADDLRPPPVGRFRIRVAEGQNERLIAEALMRRASQRDAVAAGSFGSSVIASGRDASTQ